MGDADSFCRMKSWDLPNGYVIVGNTQQLFYAFIVCAPNCGRGLVCGALGESRARSARSAHAVHAVHLSGVFWGRPRGIFDLS